ncbi:hypothetical protein BSKO_01516 [Bryopsis sp. KO-2023]|nr:hypothetical protein BSKO_01516 [Bryopsis sp. KO-2023]
MAPMPSQNQNEDPSGNLPYKQVEALAWVCQECEQECVQIRSESRCICGHRLKEHHREDETGSHRCKNSKCSCPSFFLIVAEGSWILRCRCKHRHTDHEPTTHSCKKPSCQCDKFDSPWVCNCDHAWANHKQMMVKRQVVDMSALVGQASSIDQVTIQGGAAVEINRWDLINRGQE